MKLGNKIGLLLLIVIIVAASCNSNNNDNGEDDKKAATFTSIYKGEKNDSLSIEISFDASKKRIDVCNINKAQKNIIISSYRPIHPSYSPSFGFILYAFEENDDGFTEMSENLDVDAAPIDDSLTIIRFSVGEKKCDLYEIPDSYFHFTTGKKYKFFLRYNINRDKFIESNVIDVKW
jgi:hypothetical protein